MGPMIRGFDRRKVVRLTALGVVALFTWSFIAAPSSSGDTQPPPEPADLSAYYTFGDAVPIDIYADLEAGVAAAGVGLPAFGPALAHTSTDVSLPSQASSDGLLADFGIANSINGTVTGTYVPTEATARQPGGNDSDQFTFAGGPIGNDRFARAAGGVVRVSAESSEAPNSHSTAYMGNVYLLPGTESPPEPPGSYNPDDTFPGGPGGKQIPDPGPKAQTAILSMSSIASNTQSIREADTASSFGVSEIHGIAIGNRTAEGICSNCFTIDSIRVEAYARTSGQPGSSLASYRVFLGRACRRSATAGQEADQCIGPKNPGGEDALTSIETSQLNDLFAKPMLIPAKCGDTSCVISISIHAGTTYTDPNRPNRVSNPPQDPCRNYAYPDTRKGAKKIPECELLGSKTGPDRDMGQEAKAVGEGINIDITTLTLTQLLPAQADLDSCFQGQIPDAIRTTQQYQQLFNQVGCPIPTIRQVRDFNVTLGEAVADAVARPAEVLNGGGGGGTTGSVVPPFTGGGTTGAIFPPVGGTTGGGGPPPVVVNGGLGSGKYAMKVDWSSLSIKPWKPRDMAKGIFAGAIIVGMIWLVRRRFRLSRA